ncbi:MAG: hypothetical protein AB7G13_23330 [Lautropia sp.]
MATIRSFQCRCRRVRRAVHLGGLIVAKWLAQVDRHTISPPISSDRRLPYLRQVIVRLK